MPRWFIYRQGKLQGPHTLPHLQDMMRAGGLTPADLLCAEGGGTPMRAKDVPGLFATQPAQPAPAPPAPVAPPPAPLPARAPAARVAPPPPVAPSPPRPAPPVARAPAVVAAPHAPAAAAVPAAESSSGLRTLMHLAPAALLMVPLLGLVASDFLRDLKRPETLQVLDEPGPKSEVASTSVAKPPEIIDEPDEVVNVPVKFTIADEPEERLTKVGPVKVEIKDEPGDPGGAALIDKTPLIKYALAPAPGGRMPPRELHDIRIGPHTPVLPNLGIPMPTNPLAFGVSASDAAGAARGKLLTWSANGRSNSTVVRIDGAQSELGSGQGRLVRFAASSLAEGIEPTADGSGASQSTWVVAGGVQGNRGLRFHQILEVVPGQAAGIGGSARRFLDTVLVRWVIDNQDARAHKVGLRLHLDTLIGSNDGVPFTVPGRPGLVTTSADFRQPRDVPDFIQALEVPNLQNPGTVVQLTAKLGGKVEPPDRLSITFQQFWAIGFDPARNWNYPVEDMRNDSAVILYWSEKPLKPRARRVIGFAYGLGSVTYSDKLGLTLGGSFEIGQHFTATAYVENPVKGQTLTLDLPRGLKRVEGDQTQDVPAIARPGAPAIVTWKVEVQETGTFRLVVKSSTGISQAKTIVLARPDAAHTGTLALDLAGSFAPGQVFDVTAKVRDGVAGQTLTLQLPAGLALAEGAAKQPVPAAPPGGEAVARWKVKVGQAGRFPVRVVSSTGIAQTKTITIESQAGPAANFRIALDGEFAPDKVFTVKADVQDPVAGQALTLQLPAGLARVGGSAEQRVPESPPRSLRWTVKVQKSGKFSLGVASSTGVTQRKSLVIEAAAEGGRFRFEVPRDIRIGKAFDVVATVTDPVKGQNLTLKLPRDVQLVQGAASQPVTPRAGATEATITWRVQIAQAGRVSLRIESSTGLVRAKTIVLSPEADSTLFGR